MGKEENRRVGYSNIRLPMIKVGLSNGKNGEPDVPVVAGFVMAKAYLPT